MLGLVMLVLASLPAGALAAGSPFELQLEPGYGGTARPNQWTPITVTVKNAGGDFRGTLVVGAGIGVSGQFGQGFPAQVPPGKGDYSGQATAYRIPVAVPAGNRKRFTVHVLASELIRAELLDGNDRVVASADAHLRLAAVDPLAAVVSDSETTLDALDRTPVAGTSGRIQVVHLKPADLPSSGILLRTFDLVVIDDASTDALSAGQKAALLDYAEVGGSILVATGASWRKTTAGLPPELLPVTITGTRSFPDLPHLRARLSAPALPGGAELALTERKTGVSILAEGDTPLLIEAPRGEGRVIVAAMDFAVSPFAGWSGTGSLLRLMVARITLAELPTTPGRSSGFGQPRPGLLDRGGMVGALTNIPALDLPSVRLLGLLLLGYILLIGPINYLVLRRINRRDLAWVTIPVLVLGFAASAYALGLHAKGREIIANQVRVVHLEDGWQRASVETYSGIFAPHRGTYTIGIGGQPLVAALSGGYTPTTVGALLIEPGASPHIKLTEVQAWSMRGFSSQEIMAVPGAVTERLRFANGRITGTITNHLPFALTDSVVIAGNAFVPLGTLAPGQSVTVDLAPGGTGFPGGVLPRIYPTSYGGAALSEFPGRGKLDAPSRDAFQRDAQRRTLVLQALFPTGNVGGPLFVGWSAAHLGPLQVNGKPADVHDLDAFLLPLHPAPDAAGGALDEGAARARLVDTSADSLTLSGNILTLSPHATATFEFALPGSTWHDVRIRLSRNLGPYAPKAQAGGLAVNAAEVTVYNYGSDRWEAMTVTRNGEADEAILANPDSQVSPEGLVQVRLRAGARSTVVGPPSITAQPGVRS